MGNYDTLAWSMSQWLDALATLPEDSCLVPATYMVTHNPYNSSSRGSDALHTRGMHIQAQHTQNILKQAKYIKD